jgi:hypothetical protein
LQQLQGGAVLTQGMFLECSWCVDWFHPPSASVEDAVQWVCRGHRVPQQQQQEAAQLLRHPPAVPPSLRINHGRTVGV